MAGNHDVGNPQPVKQPRGGVQGNPRDDVITEPHIPLSQRSLTPDGSEASDAIRRGKKSNPNECARNLCYVGLHITYSQIRLTFAINQFHHVQLKKPSAYEFGRQYRNCTHAIQQVNVAVILQALGMKL